MQQHWERFYTDTAVEETGFWEPTPESSLRLVDRCDLAPDDAVVDAGGGASAFVTSLLDRGFRNLTVADISPTALARARERLGDRASSVQLIEADLADPSALPGLRDVALWHDRAVLHFLLTEPQRAAYSGTVNRVVRPRGYVILSAFSLTGAPECSGLPIRNYDAKMFGEVLGSDFQLIDSFDHVYINRGGSPRPHVYALFQRVAEG